MEIIFTNAAYTSSLVFFALALVSPYLKDNCTDTVANIMGWSFIISGVVFLASIIGLIWL